MRRKDGHVVSRRYLNALAFMVLGTYRSAEFYAMCMALDGAVAA